MSDDVTALREMVARLSKDLGALLDEHVRVEAQRDALLAVAERAAEELRLLRRKDTGAVYDVTLRSELRDTITAVKAGVTR